MDVMRECLLFPAGTRFFVHADDLDLQLQLCILSCNSRLGLSVGLTGGFRLKRPHSDPVYYFHFHNTEGTPLSFILLGSRTQKIFGFIANDGGHACTGNWLLMPHNGFFLSSFALVNISNDGN